MSTIRDSSIFPLQARPCMPARVSKRAMRGFTIIELLITMATLGILLALSLPSFQETVEDVNTNARIKELLTSLGLARSEAVKRGTDVLICASNVAGTDCDLGQWNQGWIIFSDANGDANGDTGSIDAGDDIIRVYAAGRNPSAITLTAPFLSFDSMGFNSTGALQQFEVIPPGGGLSYARCIELSVVGRTSRADGECP